MENGVKAVLVGLVLLIAVILGITGFESVPNDHTGILNVSMFGNKGYQPNKTYTQGTYFVGWGRNFATIETKDSTRLYESNVLDKGGIGIKISVKVTFNPIKKETGKLIVKYGTNGGHIKRLDATVQGAIKDVLGQYTYVQIYSTKRSIVENSIIERIKSNTDGIYMEVTSIEIIDVDPAEEVMKQITALEVQDKINEKKEKEKLAATYEADARIEKARGDSSLIVTAFYQSKAIKTMKEELAKGNSQDYINYVVWKEFAEQGVSPFGNNNTFGGGQPTLTKMVK